MSMSRSASMYNSPYTYKPPPPKIDYPGFCKACDELTCSYLLDSKLLALSVLLLGIADLVIIAMMICPTWFELVFDPSEGTFGSQPIMRQLSIETGLFFMRSTKFDNLIFSDTFTGRDTVPKQLQAAQFFAVFGSCILVPCFCGGLLLMCRRFASPTALFIIAGAVSLGAVSEILVVILSGSVFGESSCDPYANSGCIYGDNLPWRMLPFYEQNFFRLAPHTTPYVKPHWAYYIAIIGAAVSVGAAICFWIEAFRTSSKLGSIRYQQLRQARDPYENDVDPHTGRKYMYQPPTRQGPNAFGMQPVLHSVRYDGTVLARPYENRPPSPKYQRHGPPSTISSASGPIVSREIDL